MSMSTVEVTNITIMRIRLPLERAPGTRIRIGILRLLTATRISQTPITVIRIEPSRPLANDAKASEVPAD